MAAQLRAAGHDVLVVDQFSEQLGPTETAERIAGFSADSVGYSCLTPNLPMIQTLTRELRRRLPAARFFAGNAHASEYPASLLACDAPVDAVVHDEGEETPVELLDAWQRGTPLSEVRGVSFVASGEVVSTLRRKPLQDLDSLAWPAWDLMPIQHYRKLILA